MSRSKVAIWWWFPLKPIHCWSFQKGKWREPCTLPEPSIYQNGDGNNSLVSQKDGGLRQGALHGERHAPKDLGGLAARFRGLLDMGSFLKMVKPILRDVQRETQGPTQFRGPPI